MIADNIEKEIKSLEERGLPSDSFFTVFFRDGSNISEKECNWSAIASEVRVKYQDWNKTVIRCIYPVKKITINHGELYTEIEVPEDCEVYQAIRGQATILGNRNDRQILGRAVGLIKDGEVVEERFLNGSENITQGWRK